MFNRYLENLQTSIQWAMHDADLDVLCLARDQHDRLLSLVTILPDQFQPVWQEQIESVLPMEWPLWMEACRYRDTGIGQRNTLH